MYDLTVSSLNVSFGAFHAVKDVSFTAAAGEFLTLLGPSGCGKSTTLGAIAGLLRPTSGRISLGSADFFNETPESFVPPEKRGIGLVFQSYALWPHMTVRQNLEYPLKLRRMSRKDRSERIAETLDLVEMSEYADRYPHGLSGGQQQRVALARTLAYRPSLMLLDEPLSNLDAKLRERARSWLRKLQTDLGLTTIYVTHDQSEALAMSDRIALISGGRIVQLADPTTIYREPANPFVADFIGSTNFLEGTVVSVGDAFAEVALENGVRLRGHMINPLNPGTRVTIAIRPESMRILDDQADTSGINIVRLPVDEAVFLGDHFDIKFRLGSNQLRVQSNAPPLGPEMTLELPVEQCRLFVGSLKGT